MKSVILTITMLAIAGSDAGFAGEKPGLPDLVPPGSVRADTSELGVVPPGTPLVVRLQDTITTRRQLRGTVYEGVVAREIQDQQGTVLIPKDSSVELVVRSLGYLGAGGAGMTELTLSVEAVVVDGVRLPVATERGRPSPGGLGVDEGGAKWVSGGEPEEQVLTRGRRISVPAGALLAFRIEDPIRLRNRSR